MEITHYKEAIENLHNCTARFKETAFVEEFYEGERVWRGNVYVFDLVGHSTANCAYAWSSPVEGSEKRKFYAVLHEGPVKSPADAVKAAIVKDYQESERR